MTPRDIRGVKWVRVLPGRPGCIPQGRPRGAKATGVKYETILAGSPGFARASHGVWLEFSDASGHGFAQVDFLFSGFVLVAAEAKLTWRLGAYVQLRRLYLPLLRALTGGPVGGIVVCQNLTRETPRTEVTRDLAEALARSACGEIPTLHLPLLATEPAPKRSQSRPRPRVPGWWNKGEARRSV